MDRVDLIAELMEIIIDCIDKNCLEDGGYEIIESEIDTLLDRYEEGLISYDED